MNPRSRGLHLRSAACALAIAIMLMVMISAGVSAHPGHEHAEEQSTSWTERIDEIAAGGGVLMLVGGVFWLSNRKKGTPVEDILPDTGSKRSPRL